VTIIPVPWFTVPAHAFVLGPGGRPVRARDHGYPDDLHTTALRCVYSDAELMASALLILTETFENVRPA